MPSGPTSSLWTSPCRSLTGSKPRAKILILSAYGDGAYVESLMAVGAVGYLEKITAATMLTQAIQTAVHGGPSFSPAIAARMAALAAPIRR